MKKIKQIGFHFLILLAMGCTHSLAQENHEHGQGVTMQDLDAHLERITTAEVDDATRKRMLRHHMQMIREQLQSMTDMGHGGMMGSMNHGGGEEGMARGGMMGGMNQSDSDSGNMAEGMSQGDAGMCGGGMCGGGMCGGMMGGMNHEGGDGGMGGMMQHHSDMVKILEHLLATQEMLLQLIED